MNQKVGLKARFVARVFSQKYGDDYDEAFSPSKKSTLLTFLVSSTFSLPPSPPLMFVMNVVL